mmetsp:Transcript_4778/g.11899  ORF Transcript_4778/g.11899 Transcript_4778/m.11899 type:complete len:342 (+) Transcript_4778:3436-4461(+)
MVHAPSLPVEMLDINREEQKRRVRELRSQGSCSCERALLFFSIHRFRLLAPLLMSIYFVVGMIVFTVWWDLSGIDALYFFVVTVTTIGYGDILPNGYGQQAFTACYILIGLVLLGYMMTVLAVFITDRHQKLITKASNMTEEQLEEETFRRTHHGFILSRLYYRLGAYRRLFAVGLALLATLGVGMLFYGLVFDLNFWEAFYFCVVTMSTVGYGDISAYPNVGAQWFSVFYMFVATVVTGTCLGAVADYFATRQSTTAAKNALERALTPEYLAEMNQDGKDEITYLDFLQFMLIKLKHCTNDDLKKIRKTFTTLDIDNSGSLTVDDLRAAFNVGESGEIHV